MLSVNRKQINVVCYKSSSIAQLYYEYSSVSALRLPTVFSSVVDKQNVDSNIQSLLISQTWLSLNSQYVLTDLFKHISKFSVHVLPCDRRGKYQESIFFIFMDAEVSYDMFSLLRGGNVAQLVENRTGSSPTQVRFPGAARDFPLSQHSVHILLQRSYTPVCNRMHLHLCAR